MEVGWRHRRSSVTRVGSIVGTLALIWSLAGCGSGLKAGGQAVVGGGANPGVFLPSAVPFGKTYGEWSAEWWKWELSIPKAASPLFDLTGEKCGVGQSGPVWFLVGPTDPSEGHSERTCMIPPGKAILFPIIQSVSWIPADAATPEALRAIQKDIIDHVTELEASVDGVALQGLRNYRFHSPTTFFFTGPANEEDTLFPGQTGTHEAYCDGFWILLEPLPPGPHLIHFGAKVVFPAVFPNVQEFDFAATYHLTVQ